MPFSLGEQNKNKNWSWDRKFEKREKQIKHNTYKTITTHIERHCFGSNLIKTLHGGKTYVLRCGSFVWSAKCYCQKITRKKCFRSEAASKLLPKYFPRHSFENLNQRDEDVAAAALPPAGCRATAAAAATTEK